MKNEEKYKIGLFSDHAGFPLKEQVKEKLQNLNLIDYGTYSNESVDYPAYGKLAGAKISSQEIDFAFLFCGSGVGITIAANRNKNVRAFVAHSEEEVELAKQHNNANAIALSARTQTIEGAIKMIEKFLATPFENGRHLNRVEQLSCE